MLSALAWLSRGGDEAFAAVSGRRAMLALSGIAVSGARQISAPVFAAEDTKPRGAGEISATEEACLSQCVYECSGGARGKGNEFKDRKQCIGVCRDKCLPKEEEEELVLS